MAASLDMIHDVAPRPFRLLPPLRTLGWTPYAWLLYLGALFVAPVMRDWSPAGWAITVVATLLFVVSYFRAYWERGERLLAIICFHVALAVGLAPWNEGAWVFFVYAASFAGQLDTQRAAIRTIAFVVLVAAIDAIVMRSPPQHWMVGCVLAPLIGGVNLHFAQVHRADTRLRLAHQEIEHLAAVAERERIARDLHDVLGHTLSLVVLKAELASRLLERDPARAAREIRDVEQVARQALAEVRETVRGYRARLDDELRAAHTLLAAAGVEVAAEVALAAPDRARDEVLALALRETATNVARHAAARRCRIRIDEADGSVRLTVEDDGRGGEVREGSGLRGMRERLEALGGTLAVDGSDGMRVVATLPLRALPDAPAPASARALAGAPS
jgi:two-component system sensor histidine kinase DesK